MPDHDHKSLGQSQHGAVAEYRLRPSCQTQPGGTTLSRVGRGANVSPQRKPTPIKVTAHPPSPWQPPVYFTSMGFGIISDISFKWNAQYVALYIWLLLLSIMFSRFIHIIACFSTSGLLLLNNIPFYLLFLHSYPYYHSCTDGHLGCFCLLAIMYNAAMNICVQSFWCVCFHFS